MLGWLALNAAASVVETNASLTQLASGLHFTEGPASDAAGNVFFADIPADTIYKWSVSNQLSVFHTNSGGANGLCFDASGNLVACEGDNGRIVSISPQLSVTVLASNYAGTRFNEPNDLWVDPAGGVYFTDPVYFGHAAVQGGEHVYYISPDRRTVTRVVADMVRPNGLVGTADGKTLYIADWGAANVFRYTTSTNGTLTSKTMFAGVKCDGMTLDAEGNLYFCESAVLVYNAAGQKAEQISVPARPTNVEFGGSDRRTLFITTDRGLLYSIRMRVRGAAPASTNTGLRSAVWTNGLMQFAITGSLGQSYSVMGWDLSFGSRSVFGFAAPHLFNPLNLPMLAGHECRCPAMRPKRGCRLGDGRPASVFCAPGPGQRV